MLDDPHELHPLRLTSLGRPPLLNHAGHDRHDVGDASPASDEEDVLVAVGPDRAPVGTLDREKNPC